MVEVPGKMGLPNADNVGTLGLGTVDIVGTIDGAGLRASVDDSPVGACCLGTAGGVERTWAEPLSGDAA